MMIISGCTVCESTKATTRSSTSARPRVAKIRQTFACRTDDGRLISPDMATCEQTVEFNIHLVGQCMFFWKSDNGSPSCAGFDRPTVPASKPCQHLGVHAIDAANAALLPTPRKRALPESRSV